MASLTERGVHAAIWNYAGNISRIVLQFGIGVLLSRLLGPHGFGLVAVAFLLIGFGQLFVDFGFNAAIIQSRELDPRELDFLFTVQILVGAAMTALGIVGAEVIAAFFHQPDAAPVVRWMSLIFVFRAVGQTAVALLNRDLEFRAIQITSTIAYLVGYLVVGVPMALVGMGPWSVVAAQLVQTALSSILAMLQVGHTRRFSLRSRRPELLRFGRSVVSASLGSWTLANLDALIVGHVSGTTTLSLYNRAMNLANAPMGVVISGVQGVLFAASARAQDDPDGCRRGLYACIELLILTAGPVLLAIAMTARTVTVVVYGPQWIGAAHLLTPLCIAMVLNGILSFFGPVLMGVGRVERESRAQWIAVALMAPVLLLCAHVSAAAVAWSVIPLCLLRLLLLARALHGVLPLDLGEMARAAAPASMVALLTGAAAAASDHLGPADPLGLRLVIDVAAAAVGLLVGLVLMRRKLVGGPLGSVLLPVVPARMYRLLIAQL